MSDPEQLVTTPGLWQFLKTKRSPEELKTALEVIREFKEHESEAEWLSDPFLSWAKLEQLEEYLALLVGELADVRDETAKVLLMKFRSEAK